MSPGRIAAAEAEPDRGGPAAVPSGGARTVPDVPSRNASCPCGSGRKHKRCCLERSDAVAGELRARGRLMDDVIEWLRREHEQTLRRANGETVLIRMLGGPTGRSMSLMWALNDYLPDDGGPPLMARYAERAELASPARAIARRLADARLDAHRVRAKTPGMWLELDSLTARPPARLAWRDWCERLQVGDVLLARIVDGDPMATVWGHAVGFPGDTERRWRARLAALPSDPADAALAVIEFDPDDAAEPLPDGIELCALSWSIDDHDAVLDALDTVDRWEDIGESLPRGWAFAWPAAPATDDLDLGGWTEDDGQIEVARLIVDEREVSLISATRATLTEIAAQLEAGLRDVIKPNANRLAA
jgi:SEC-C motif-containing protein